jgi:hypothetical protein
VPYLAISAFSALLVDAQHCFDRVLFFDSWAAVPRAEARENIVHPQFV